ncbi:MAG: protein-L-isoaspartate(D-aspartate) O-methyltransferase [Bacteroidia bacterium]|nr:protein-L-isoaspartate(D-aspartate) O-methyltransferase [Bacteroidia bacterium]
MVQSDEAWKKKAREMVNTQIIARNVNDKRVIDVMMNIPRHLFVPVNMQKHAYVDGPLPIGKEQTISQPYIVALMTELLQLKGDEKVLEIGTGSGYQAAVLSQLVDTCYSIELIKELADRSSKLLNELGMHNVVVKCGDGYQGWPAHAPFDRIIVTAAPEVIPPKLVEQLKVGGRMVIPVGTYYQELMVITKDDNGEIMKESIIPVRFVPMVYPEE